MNHRQYSICPNRLCLDAFLKWSKSTTLEMRPSWRCEAVREGSLTATAEQSLMEGDEGCLPSVAYWRSGGNRSTNFD
jgi:hypothetical protein